MLATANPDDFKSSNASKMDETLLVRFFHKEREDKAKTLAEGRPCFKETEYIEIRVPGQRDVQACRPASPKDKSRFPRHYDAFLRRVEVPEEGTLLKEWPQISRSQVEEFSFMNVKTLEQLSVMSDTHASKIHGGLTLKNRAMQWLESAGESKLIAEKEALQERLALMDKQMAEMQELLAQRPEPARDLTEPAPDAPEDQAVEVKKTATRPRRSTKK